MKSRPSIQCLILICVAMLESGCSVFSPEPLWELVKGAGAAASLAIPYGGSEASNTVSHLHDTPSQVCIEFNADTAVPNIVPALQIELRRHQIESRVYEADPAAVALLADRCPAWLSYEARVAWDTPPMGGGSYRSYVTSATLTLRSSTGRILSSSQYEMGGMGLGKWASTQSKLAPVVSALITGLQS